MAVEVKTNPTFVLGRATELFPTDGFSSDAYAVAPDDRRFLMIRPLATGTPDKLIVVENWFEELKAKSRKVRFGGMCVVSALRAVSVAVTARADAGRRWLATRRRKSL